MDINEYMTPDPELSLGDRIRIAHADISDFLPEDQLSWDEFYGRHGCYPDEYLRRQQERDRLES